MVDQRRGQNVATAGAVFQTAFSIVMLIVWRWTGSDAAMACLWLLVGGIALWLMALALFYCRVLQQREAIELDELAAGGGKQGAIFERGMELELRPAAKRVAWMERWITPIFTVLWAAGHVVAAVLTIRYLGIRTDFALVSPGEASLFLILIGFVSLLLSFYALGMGRYPQWRLLRATGSYLLVNSLLIAATTVAMVASWLGKDWLDNCIAYAVPAVQLVLALELVMNFVLDLYRPRVPDQERRPSFDSRLLNLVAEPGKVGHSLAEALNYQFGFEVSKTWFYQLVSRAFVPLLIVGALIMLGMTSLVIVPDGQQCVLRHFGKIDAARSAALTPGLHFKLPWPVETVDQFNTASLDQVLLGAGGERTPEEIAGDYINGKQVLLWTAEHGKLHELDFVIAVPPHQGSVQSTRDAPPPVSVIKLVVSVQYNVGDVYKYYYRFVDPAGVLQCLAYRELTRYCATATLDTPVQDKATDRPEALMTYGRQRAADALVAKIQAAADQLDMGVKIKFVEFLAVHPPKDAAEEFDNVLKAERAQTEKRFKAEAEAGRILTNVAGDPVAALKLAQAIQKLDDLEELQRVAAVGSDFTRKLDEMVNRATENVRDIEREVEQERLMGKLRAQEQTGKEQLRDDYRKYLALLESIRQSSKAGKAFDFVAQIATASQEADALFALASGEPAAMVAAARAERWKKEMDVRGTWEAFPNELLAYQASPSVYMLDRWLAVWDQSLPEIQKYVLCADRDLVDFRLNWHREVSPLEGVDFGASKQEAGKAGSSK